MAKSLQSRIKDNYSGVKESISRCYSAYGGWEEILCSPYLHLAVLLSFLSWPVLAENANTAWYQTVISVMPSILGFTLGGYAILLAFGSEKFLSLLVHIDHGDEGKRKASHLMRISSSFVHFLLIQVVSILIALFGLAWQIKYGVFAFIGQTVFFYALLLAVATVFSMMSLVRMFQTYLKSETDKQTEEEG